MSNEAPPALSQAGSAAIYGFLYQLSASLDGLIGAHFGRSGTAVDPETLFAIIEPRAGSDLVIAAPHTRIAYQFKHRKAPLGASALAAKVIPDLYRAHCDKAADAYILQTTNGLSKLARELAQRIADAAAMPSGSDWLGTPGLAEVHAHCMPIHEATGADGSTFEGDLQTFLGRFAVAEPVPLDQAQRGVLAWLKNILPYPEQAAKKLDQLIGYLAGKARHNDAAIRLDELRAELGLAPMRDAAPASARERLAGLLADALAKRPYDAAFDVREPVDPRGAPVSAIVGESGHGKSWRLFRTAAAFLETGQPAVLIRASTRADLEKQMTRVIAVEALGLAEPIQSVLLGKTWQKRCGDDEPVAILWEGCRDAADLDAIALENGLGPGLLLIAEYPVGGAAPATPPTYRRELVEQFTAIELFQALERRGIEAGLVPRNIRAMLHRPVLCGIYATLALEKPGWDPQNEYRVLEDFWARARYRAGRFANVRLKALARHIIALKRSHATDDDMDRIGFTEAELEQLLAAGWLSNLGSRWSFAHDRLLTWAVAEALALDFSQQLRTAADLVDTIVALDADRDTAPGALARLGFLPMDILWLVSKDAARANEVATLLAGLESDDRTGAWDLYHQLLPTGGPRMLSAVAARAKQLGASDAHIIPHLVAAMRMIVGSDDAIRQALLDDLWAHESESSREAALTLAASWPFHTQREALWTEYCARSADRESDRFDLGRTTMLDEVIQSIVRSDPDWLAGLIESERSAEEYRLAAYFLKSLDAVPGQTLWTRTRERLREKIDLKRQTILIDCIDRFGSVADAAWLSANAKLGNLSAPKCFAALCGIDPGTALDLLATRPAFAPPRGRVWLDRLLDHDEQRARRLFADWLEDDSSRALATLFARAEDRVDDALIERLLASLDKVTGTAPAPPTPAPVSPLLRLLGSLTLDPRHDAQFHRYQESPLSARLRKRAFDHFDGKSDTDYVAVRRILRRIGGADYEALILHALSPNDLGRARTGIVSAIFSPTPRVVARLEALASTPQDDEGDATEARLGLWRVLLALAPERWRPRLAAMLTSDDADADAIGFALRLLPEYQEAGDQAHLIASLRRQEPGSALEARLLNAAALAGDADLLLTERALGRLAMPEGDDDGLLGALNALLQDRAPGPRAALDAYLDRLVTAKSWKSYEAGALVIRLGQGGASERLWAAGERVGGRSLFSDGDFIARLAERDPTKALNILLDRAFSHPDFVTNAQPAAIETLAKIDEAQAAKAFRLAWTDYPDRRRHLAHAVRGLGADALAAMVDTLEDDYAAGSLRPAYRAACVELRRGHESVGPYLIERFAATGAAGKEALLEPIGWMPDGVDRLNQILAAEPDRMVWRKAYDVRRAWLDAAGAIDRFRAHRTLETMEFALDVCEPEPTYMWGDPLRIIDEIREDPKLVYYAEQQLARRINSLTKSNFSRFEVRPRRPGS